MFLRDGSSMNPMSEGLNRAYPGEEGERTDDEVDLSP